MAWHARHRFLWSFTVLPLFMGMLQQIGPSNAGWQRSTHMSGMLLLEPLLTASVIAHLGHAGSYWLVALMFLLTVARSQRVLRQRLPAPTAPVAPRPPGIQATMAKVLGHMAGPGGALLGGTFGAWYGLQAGFLLCAPLMLLVTVAAVRET